MEDKYQKVAYISLRNPDGSFMTGVPLYVRVNDFTKRGMTEEQEKIITVISKLMMDKYDKQLAAIVANKNIGDKANAEISC